MKDIKISRKAAYARAQLEREKAIYKNSEVDHDVEDIFNEDKFRMTKEEAIGLMDTIIDTINWDK